ncbi:MAG: Rpn family recombination-promoting nuclease/putative transposase [Thermoguttaceae bacterium]|nr:Rpn family recombination-promoting nuclease/putative transposase [Thermoguttaceae bacterium]
MIADAPIDDEGWVDLCSDAVFRPVFGSDDSKPCLKGLLNPILREAGELETVDLTYKNPFQFKEVKEARESIMDIFVEDSAGKRYNVEMQTHDHRGFTKRSILYPMRAFVEQYANGSDYDDIKPVLGVDLVRFPIFSKKPNVWFEFWRPTGVRTGDVLPLWGLIRVRVPFPGETPEGIEDEELRNWLMVLGNYSRMSKAERDYYETITPGFKEARKKLNAYTSEERRLLQLAAVEREMTRKAIAADARDEGRDEGRDEAYGSVIRNMLRMGGFTLDKIAEIVGIPVAQVEDLANKTSLA